MRRWTKGNAPKPTMPDRDFRRFFTTDDLNDIDFENDSSGEIVEALNEKIRECLKTAPKVYTNFQRFWFTSWRKQDPHEPEPAFTGRVVAIEAFSSGSDDK